MNERITGAWESGDGRFIAVIVDGTTIGVVNRDVKVHPTELEALAAAADLLPDGAPFQVWQSEHLPNVTWAKSLA